LLVKIINLIYILDNENKKEASRLYELGINEFLLGLSIKLKGDDIERAKNIQDKMESNLKKALERVTELSNILLIVSYLF
jgi:hypothetical protein